MFFLIHYEQIYKKLSNAKRLILIIVSQLNLIFVCIISINFGKSLKKMCIDHILVTF